MECPRYSTSVSLSANDYVGMKMNFASSPPLNLKILHSTSAAWSYHIETLSVPGNEVYQG